MDRVVSQLLAELDGAQPSAQVRVRVRARVRG